MLREISRSSRRPNAGDFLSIKVKDELIAEPYPAWTAIGVTELITVGTLIEVRVIAKRAR